MRSAKVIFQLNGSLFGLEPVGHGSISISKAVEVTDFCSINFVSNDCIALIEFGESKEKGEVFHFKTRFKNCGPTVSMVSQPFISVKMNRGEFRKFLESDSSPIPKNWGISLSELVELFFQHSQILSAVPDEQVLEVS
jgi:hypothetical protein